MSVGIEIAPKVPIYGDLYSVAGGLPPVGEYLGKIISPPAGWTSPNDKVSSGNIIHLRKYLPTSPYKYGLIAGRDHVGNSTCGAYLWVSNSLTSGWTYYDSSIAAEFTSAGWSGHPSSNPIATISAASDYGEYPAAFYDAANSRFVLCIHSSSYLVGQTQIAFTSTNFLTWTNQGSPHDALGFASSAHDGYGSYAWGAQGIVGTAVYNDLKPLNYQIVRSRDGLNFATDHRKMYGRDCAHWGINNKEMPACCPVVYFDGRPWRIGGYRDIPGSGGATTNGVLVAAPVSSDLRRLVGPAYVLTGLGAGGTDHAVATSDGASDRLFVDDDGILYVTHQIQNAAGTRAIGLTRITPRESQLIPTNTPVPAWITASGYEAGVAIDGEGMPLPAGRTRNLRTLADLDFAVVTSTPSNATETLNTGTPTFTYTDGSSGRGQLAMAVDAANEDGIYQVGPSLNTANWQELWVEVDGIILASSNNFAIQVGFTNAAFNRLWYLDCRNASGEYGRFNVFTGSSNLTDAGGFALFEDDRYQASQNLKVGIVKRRTGTKTAKVYLELWDGDQIIAKRDITALHTDNTVRAFLRVIRHSTGNNTLSFTAVRVKGDHLVEGT